MIIGLTGSIAKGKSEVAKIFSSQGIPVFDADVEVHKLYDSTEGADLIRPFVPEAVVDGTVNRKIITEHVLRNPTLLSRLEKNIHAEIKKRRIAFIACARQNNEKLILIDAPLLFEAGIDQEVDVTITVTSRPELQHKRALSRAGMTQARFDMIVSKQMPDAEKIKRSTYIIENNGTLEELATKTKQLITTLKAKSNA